jgi:hypothetical protein
MPQTVKKSILGYVTLYSLVEYFQRFGGFLCPLFGYSTLFKRSLYSFMKLDQELEIVNTVYGILVRPLILYCQIKLGLII